MKSKIKYIYFVLALAGGGYTYYELFLGLQENAFQFNILNFVKSTWISNDHYSRSITLDFWTSAIAGSIFVLSEGIRLKMKFIWLYIIAIFLIAFAFAFPLFLFMREKHIETQ